MAILSPWAALQAVEIGVNALIGEGDLDFYDNHLLYNFFQ